MSRSHRYSPCYVIGWKSYKRIARKKVRKIFKALKDVGQYNYYKRLHESYDIRDYVWYSEKERRNNKLFRKAARIARGLHRGKLNPSEYDLHELLKTLEDYKGSFWYTNKK